MGTNPYLVVHSISLLMTPSMTLTALLVPVYLPHHLLPLLLHHGTQLGKIIVLVVLTLEATLDFMKQKAHVSDITTTCFVSCRLLSSIEPLCVPTI